MDIRPFKPFSLSRGLRYLGRRRGVLRWTVAGTALSYLVWVFSGSFWLFLLSRIVSGLPTLVRKALTAVSASAR